MLQLKKNKKVSVISFDLLHFLLACNFTFIPVESGSFSIERPWLNVAEFCCSRRANIELLKLKVFNAIVICLLIRFINAIIADVNIVITLVTSKSCTPVYYLYGVPVCTHFG